MFCAVVSMFLYNVVLAEHYMDNLSGNNGALSYIKLLICPAICRSRCIVDTIICWTAQCFSWEMLWVLELQTKAKRRFAKISHLLRRPLLLLLESAYEGFHSYNIKRQCWTDVNPRQVCSRGLLRETFVWSSIAVSAGVMGSRCGDCVGKGVYDGYKQR